MGEVTSAPVPRQVIRRCRTVRRDGVADGLPQKVRHKPLAARERRLHMQVRNAARGKVARGIHAQRVSQVDESSRGSCDYRSSEHGRRRWTATNVHVAVRTASDMVTILGVTVAVARGIHAAEVSRTWARRSEYTTLPTKQAQPPPSGHRSAFERSEALDGSGDVCAGSRSVSPVQPGCMDGASPEVVAERVGPDTAGGAFEAHPNLRCARGTVEGWE